MDPDDRICRLIFDEMSLKQHLQYDGKRDIISGYEDYGTERENNYSNTALVFLVQGLRKAWKNPVGYYLVNSKMESSKKKTTVGKKILDFCIKEVITAYLSIGLNIVSNVCDMGSNNVAVLQQLGFTYNDPKIDIDGNVIFIFFDPPHLLKCTPNLFLKYLVKCQYTIGEHYLTESAAIDYVIKAISADKRNIFRTDYQRRINLLHSVSKGELPNDALGTAMFIRAVDDLFDSFNGSTTFPQHGKELKIIDGVLSDLDEIDHHRRTGGYLI
ncbi:transposase protein [Holotrichia oblita]|uniref:Transposase protein n=1 Tax=Holotrichia oblita TaxID=644536 RepID=A0ACB9T8T8_HOLOL|nr:transposase protein [Holotrichia oblita]